MAEPWEIDWSAHPASGGSAGAGPWTLDWTGGAGPAKEVSPTREAAAVALSPVKGALNTAGGFGDATDLGIHIGNWIVGKLFGPEARARQEANLAANAPIVQAITPQTSADIRKGVEKFTGEMPEAETTGGKYASAVGEMIPGALAMGPEGAIANVGKLAVAPGLASEYLGNKVQGTWLEPWFRLVGALGGGVGASGAGRLGEALANRGAASTAAQEAGNVSPGAVARVAKSYQADQLNPAAVAQRQAELGPEAMMLDMGRQLGGRAEAIASQPGRGQNAILDAVEGRTGTFGSGTADRIRDTLDQTMGPSPDIVATRNHINDTVDRLARPLYDQVMSAHPVVDVPSSITSRPVVAQAMRDAVSLARNHGEQLSQPVQQTTLNAGGVPITQTVQRPAQTSLAYWDYVKKALDSRIGGMMRSGGVQDLNSQDKADLAGLLSAKNALVNHLDNVTGGQYGVARRAAATKFEVNDAIEFGRSALNTKLLPEELDEQMNGMSLPQQAGVQVGMRRDVDRVIDTARNDGAAARRILDTNQNREKIARVFGQDAADAIDRRIAAETRFQEATNKIAANSRTAVRSQLVKDTESPSVSAPPSTTILGLAHEFGIRRPAQYLSDMSLDRTREGIGDLLTRQGDDVPRLAEILSRYNAARASNAAPALSRQAGGLAGVLSGQFPAWLENQPK